MSKERDLILPGIPQGGGRWADFGSGTGIFTLVLREIAGPTTEIYSIDRDARTLEKQRAAFASRYPGETPRIIQADFTQRVDLPPLDGIVMANALHFVPFDRQQAALDLVTSYLRPDGKFIIVEYNSRRGNPWVPYPVDYTSFEFLAEAANLKNVLQLAAVPSTFLSEMYSAQGLRK